MDKIFEQVFEWARCGIYHNYAEGEFRENNLKILKLVEEKFKSTYMVIENLKRFYPMVAADGSAGMLADNEGAYVRFSDHMDAIRKTFNIMSNIGRVKYVVNYHDGEKKHRDGSNFFDIATFKNKKKRDTFIKGLLKSGYTETGIYGNL
jgi:hypothetical protein